MRRARGHNVVVIKAAAPTLDRCVSSPSRFPQGAGFGRASATRKRSLRMGRLRAPAGLCYDERTKAIGGHDTSP